MWRKDMDTFSEVNMDSKQCIYEGMLARAERSNRRLIIVVILALVFLFLTNLAWLYVWQMYDYEGVTVDSSNGVANYVGERGIINGSYYGEAAEKE